MDKTVNVRIFSVRKANDTVPDFSAALRGIINLELKQRELETDEDVVIRLERLEENGQLMSGELIRLQISNLPSEAQTGVPVRSLGVASIGHSTIFAYNKATGLLALQLARNGITSSRVAMYVDKMIQNADYDVLPLQSEEIRAALRRGRVRAVRIKTASGDTIEAVDARTRGVTEGFRHFKEALGTSSVDVTLTNDRGSMIPKETVLGLFSWFRRHQDSSSGRGNKLRAAVIRPGGGQAEWLDLLNGQMGERQKLDLPGDDPDVNYGIRKAFVEGVLTRHEAAAEEQGDDQD